MASNHRRIKAFTQLQHLSATPLGNGSSSLCQELRSKDILEPQKIFTGDEEIMNRNELCTPRVDSWLIAMIFRSRHDEKAGQYRLNEVVEEKDGKYGVAVRIDVRACRERFER